VHLRVINQMLLLWTILCAVRLLFTFTFNESFWVAGSPMLPSFSAIANKIPSGSDFVGASAEEEEDDDKTILELISPRCKKPITSFIGCMTRCVSQIAGADKLGKFLVSVFVLPRCTLGKCRPPPIECIGEITSIGSKELRRIVNEIVRKAIRDSMIAAKTTIKGAGIVAHTAESIVWIIVSILKLL